MSTIPNNATLTLLSDDYVSKATSQGFKSPAIIAAVNQSLASIAAPVNTIAPPFTLGLCVGPTNDPILLWPEIAGAIADLKIGGLRAWFNPTKWTDPIDPAIFANVRHWGQLDNTIVIHFQGAAKPYAPTPAEMLGSNGLIARFPGPAVSGANCVEYNEQDFLYTVSGGGYTLLNYAQTAQLVLETGPAWAAKGYGLIVSVSRDIGLYDALNKAGALKYVRWIGHHTYNGSAADKIAADTAQIAQVESYQKQGLNIGYYQTEWGYHMKGNPAAPAAVTTAMQWAKKQTMRAGYYAAVADAVHAAGYEGLFTQNPDGSLTKTPYYAALKAGVA